MPIDTTPSAVATNALNAIPFSSLIGGPLDACIKAQAQAAMTSYEFINEVGLTVDPDTNEKKPVNVTFQYNNNGNLTTLTVPLLVIVPIPYLAIDKVAIDFIANISAASSNVVETSNDSELGVEATAEAKLGIGPFSVKINASANYSAKQHSKSASDSRYSVEYTMNVSVEGGQADIPSGLQTVLNILQGSSSSVGPNEMVAMFPANIDFDRVQTGNLQVTIKDNQGLRIGGTKVQVNVQPKISGQNSPFQAININQGFNEADVVKSNLLAARGIPLSSVNDHNVIVPKRVRRRYSRLHGQNMLNSGSNTRLLSAVSQSTGNLHIANQSVGVMAPLRDPVASKVGVTDSEGNVGFEFVLADNVYTGTEEYQGYVIVTAAVPYSYPNGEQKIEEEVFKVPYAIVPDAPSQNNIAELSYTGPGPIQLTPTAGSDNVAIKAISLNEEELPTDYMLNVSITDISGVPAATLFKPIVAKTGTAEGTPTATQAAIKVNSTGEIEFTIEINPASLTEDSKYRITVNAASGDAAPLTIDVEANK